MDLDKKIQQFMQTNMPNSTIDVNDIPWLIALFKKTKAQQKTDSFAFLDTLTAQNSTRIANESTDSATRVSNLQADNTIISNIKNTF